MTRIDFYVLASDDSDSRLTFTARLCEKALNQGLPILVVASQEQQLRLDAILWDFRADAFVPHGLWGTHSQQDRLIISTGEDVADFHGLLINLTDTLPPMFSRFSRFAAVVNQDSAVLQHTRAHYSFFKERGYAVSTHKLN